jgi:hypothetical protein
VILGMASSSLGAINQEQMYVSSTRFVEGMTLYTDDKEAVRAGVQRSSQKLAALDLQTERRPIVPDGEEARQRHLDQQRRIAGIQRTRASYGTPTPGRPGPGGGRAPSPHVARYQEQQQLREGHRHGR